MNTLRKKIGDILIAKGLITTQQLNSALEEQNKSGGKLGQILIDKKLISEEELSEAISDRLGIQKISLKSLVIDPRIISKVPVELARRYELIPVFKIGDMMTVAMADPLNIIAIDELKYLTKFDIKRVIASASEITEAIDEYYSVADSMNDVIGEYPGAAEKDIALTAIDESAIAEQDTPVVKLVNLLITTAVKAKASDIHIEPDENVLRIRYRINGIMKKEASPPKNLQSEIISRIKVAANMDVSEKRLPQDGRLMMRVDDYDIDLRISTLPTINGEKIVIRILDKRVLNIGLEQLGFSESILKKWENLIHVKEGLILITGPTSSGKTTTLYSVLQEINSSEKNIITVEDPVEYSLPMINQVQTNEKAGLTFARVLRSILRQNPDIIMIGEMRDAETASMAIRAALTGHLVFSTIHTNDAPSSIARLADMGIESYLVASAIKGVLAQRLLRTNCPHCLEAYEPTDIHLRLANYQNLPTDIKFRKSVGCNKCRMTSYMGQTGIYELIEIDEKIAEMIISGVSEVKIRNYAYEQGYRPLFQSGMEKVIDGTVCLEELLRVASIGEGTVSSEMSKQRVSINV